MPIVCFSPTPSNRFHVGLARTAVISDILTKKLKGALLLRLDDLSRNFTTDQYETIYSGLRMLGISNDYGPFFQSKRNGIYEKYAEVLVNLGLAYRCTCKRDLNGLLNGKKYGYNKKCRNKKISKKEDHVIRLKVLPGKTKFYCPLRRKEISVDNELLEDVILLKSDRSATYPLAYAVDDHLMKVDYRIRSGQIFTTSLIVYILNSLNWDVPNYIHLGILLSINRNSRLDNCKHKLRKGVIGIKYLENYFEAGYSKETIYSFLSIIGLNSDNPTGVEYKNIVDNFSLTKINPRDIALPIHFLDRINCP